MGRTLKYYATCFLLLMGTVSHAFTFSDGSTGKCTAAGVAVVEMDAPLGHPIYQMGLTGMTTPIAQGRFAILWNTAKLASLPPEAHDYIFFHECAHARVPTSDELIANCAGLKDMRSAGHSSPEIEKSLKKFHTSLGYMGPRYGVGSDYWSKTVQCAGGDFSSTDSSVATQPTLSSICLFTFGPRTGIRVDYAPMPPLPIGTPCNDGWQSTGVVVP